MSLNMIAKTERGIPEVTEKETTGFFIGFVKAGSRDRRLRTLNRAAK